MTDKCSARKFSWPTRYALCLLAIFLFATITIGEADARDLKAGNNPPVFMKDLPVCLEFSERTDQRPGSSLLASITYPDSFVSKYDIMIQKHKDGKGVIMLTLKADKDAMEGDYEFRIGRSPDDFIREFEISDKLGPPGSNPDKKCPGVVINLVAGRDAIDNTLVKSNIFNNLPITESSVPGNLEARKNASLDIPTHPYALHIAIIVAATSMAFSIVFFRRFEAPAMQIPSYGRHASLPKGYGSGTSKGTSKSGWPGVLQLDPRMKYNLVRFIAKPITYNIVVFTWYLVGMSLVVEPGLALYREVVFIGFTMPLVPPDVVSGGWYQLIIADSYLPNASKSITDPSIHLFYAVFVLPFMIMATRRLWRDDPPSKRKWVKKITIYVVIILVIKMILFLSFLTIVFAR